MQRILQNYYELKQGNQHIVLREPKPYSHYVEQVTRGPQDIDENGLIEMFDLEEYNEYSMKYENMINEKKTSKVESFNYTVKFKEAINAETVWNLSFVFWNLYLKRYFGLQKVPIRLLYHGRHYQQSYFFDTIGDFLDLIPVLVEVNEEEPINMINNAREKVERATKHNINFMSLMQDTRVKQRWMRTTNLITPGQGKRGDGLIIFNFEEKKTLQEVTQSELSNQVLETFILTDLYCEVHYTPTVSSINVFSSLGINRPLLRKIIEEEIEIITGKLDIDPMLLFRL
jgi:hypothetical protein